MNKIQCQRCEMRFDPNKVAGYACTKGYGCGLFGLTLAPKWGQSHLTAVQPDAHVNETPKIEHEAENMLTLDAAAIREAALREVLALPRHDFGQAIWADHILALIDKPGKEVMQDESGRSELKQTPAGLSAGGGADTYEGASYYFKPELFAPATKGGA